MLIKKVFSVDSVEPPIGELIKAWPDCNVARVVVMADGCAKEAVVSVESLTTIGGHLGMYAILGHLNDGIEHPMAGFIDLRHAEDGSAVTLVI